MSITDLHGKPSEFLSSLWTWWSALSNQEQLTTSLLTIILLIFWYTWLIKTPSKLPPGPRGYPLVGNLLSLDPELHTHFAELAATWGPIYRLQLGSKLCVVVTSPSLAKEVLKDHDAVFANRDPPAAAKEVAYEGRDIVWSQYGPEWRLLRRVCVKEMLGNASLDAVHTLRRTGVRRMMEHVYGRAQVGSPINVVEQMFLTVLNVITSMMWGGTLEGDERSTSIGAEFRDVVGEITDLLGKPNLSDFYPGLGRFDLQGIQKKIREKFTRIDRIFDSIIEKRMKMKDGEGKESHDFLQLMLKLKAEEDSKTPFTMMHIRALLMDMVVGGTDTTSNTVEWAVAELMNKPEMMKKAQDELEQVVGLDSMVEESHIPQLHYLQKVLKEVLRLHPALPLLVPHCPISSCNVGGYLIPEGTRVFVNVWAIHRDPMAWANPLEFDPERFSNTKFDFSGKDFSYFPFGSGRRICAGIPMAERMFMYELATLLHSFDWGMEGGAKIDLKEKFGIVLKKATPLIAVPTPRLSSPALYA